MKTSASVFKRLLAVLMVFSLVIGYVPVVDAAAEATVEITYGKVPTVTVTRTQEEVPVESAPDEGEDVPATSEGEDVPATSEGDEAAPGAGGAPVPEPTYQYTYTVAVTAGEESVEADEIKWTGYDDVTGNKLEDVDAASATVTVTYKGMVVTVTSSSDEAATATWEVAKRGTLETVQKGIYFQLPTSEVNNVAAEVTHTYTVDGNEASGKQYTVNDTCTVVETIKVGQGEEAVTVATVTYKPTVGATPVPKITLSADPSANENGWNNSNVTVTVSAKDLGFVSGDYLPDVTNSSGVVGKWELQEDGTWTNKVTVTKTDTISCGEQKLDVQIDTVKPEAKITRSEQLSDETTYVEFEVTKIGTSGVGSVTINGQAASLDEGKLTGTCVLPGHVEETKIVVTSNAGKSSDEASADVQPALAITITKPEIKEDDGGIDGGTIDGITYVRNGEKITFTVVNADGDYSPIKVMTIQNGDGEAVDVTPAEGVYTVDYEITGDVNGLTVYVKDAMGRELTETFDVRYKLGQTNPPEVDIGAPVKNWEKKSTTITITVTDADGNLRAEENQGSIKLTYEIVKTEVEWNGPFDYNEVTKVTPVSVEISEGNLNGWTRKGNTYTYVIEYKGQGGKTTVENTVVEVKDNTSDIAEVEEDENEAVFDDGDEPKIDAYFVEGNVTALHEINGEWFAVLEPTDYDSEEENPEIGNAAATLRIVVSDATSLTAANLQGDGWQMPKDNQTGKFWYKDIVVNVPDYQTAQMEIIFGATDGENTTRTNVILSPSAQTMDGNTLRPNMPIAYNETLGYYYAVLNFDRRAPGSSNVVSAVPTITVTDDFVSEVDSDIYNKEFTFTVNIDDNVYVEKTTTNDDGTVTTSIVPGGFNSGVKSVKWEIADGIEANFLDAEGSGDYAGEYKITVSPNGNNETSDAALKIVVADVLGNTYTFNKAFEFDNKGPQITVDYDNNVADNEKFFKDVRTATITASDLNYNGMTVNGEICAETTNVVKFETEGKHALSVTATDLAGNVADVDYINKDNIAPTDFYIDLNAPKIDVVVSGATTAVNSDEKANYYNGEITYTFTVTDMFIVEDKVTAEVKYEDGTSDTIEMTLTTKENKNETDMDTYTGSITLKNGQVVTDIVVNALDKSGKTSQWSHTGNENKMMIVVDTTDPEITVTKTIANDGKRVQTYEIDGVEYAYYADEVTYDIVVSDSFLTEEVGTCIVTVEYADGIEVLELSEEFVKAETLAGKDEYKYSFKLEGAVDNSRVMKNISFEVVDNAGNVAAKPDVSSASDTDFAKNGNVWNYNGNPIVVDTVAPTATVEFSKNVKSLYTNGNKLYVILDRPVDEESSVSPVDEPETVVVTFQVTDMNLAIDNDNAYGVKTANKFEWSGENPVNEETTLTYRVETTVAADGTAMFEIDVTVFDLAGHALENVVQNRVTENDQVWSVNVGTDEENKGSIKYIVYVDRRRPTSNVEDNKVPTIILEPTEKAVTTIDGKELFNAEFVFNISVNDGAEGSNNSGLKNIQWKLTDDAGVVIGTPNNAFVEKSYTEEQTFKDEIPIEINAGGEGRRESDQVELTVSAEDNVGNKITIVKKFCIDVEAPEITFSVEERQDRPEGKYFNHDRFITVHVEDLHFDSANTTIKDLNNASQKGDWTRDGNVWSCIVSYTVDGDYGLEVQSTDLAKHTTVKGDDSYDDSNIKNIEDFTIDKTAPVIHVNFNPFVPVDTDGNLVQYFNDVRTVTVTIEEHNFDANDVDADLGNANALGAWTSNGDNHTASEMFTEGNNYQVNVNYTDLAGNPATPYTSPTFSVDLTAPEIVMNKGSLTTGSLNIVPDDLLLGFAITDNQDNLKDFDVEVVFLNNGYQQTKVEGAEYYTVTEGDRTTGYIDFTNIASDKANDGIYTVRVSAIDYAGHQVYFPDVVFSLNRFGSTFTVSDGYTSDFLTTDASGVIYQSEVRNPLVVTEINPNRVWQDSDHSVEGSVITVAANGTSVTLVPGTDYDVSVTEMGNGNSKWYEYTYTINPEVFHNNQELVDGEYTIFFYSEDEAGNKNTNESNEGSALLQNPDGEYSGKITFTLDHMSPVVTILNIEEGGQYVEANRNVEINVSDNTPVSIAVYINDVLVEFVESADGQPLTSDWLTYDPQTGNYVLNMSEKDVVQNVRVVVTDAAGNVYEQTVGDITLTENLWIQFINNQALVIGSIVGLIGLIILIILLLKKRKKEEDENQNAAV